MQRTRKKIRVVSHLDLDAFYAQVEAQAHPHLKGMEIAVMQYNPFGDLSTVKWTENRVQNDSNGSIIALAYGQARAAGVKRNMRGGEARKLAPSLQLVQVPTSNGKADLTNYRRCGQLVLNVLARPAHGVEVVCEMASIDESYLDVTAAAEHLLATKGSPAQMLPMHVDQMRIGFQGASAPDEPSSQHLDASTWFQRSAPCWDVDEQLLAWGAVIVAEKRAAVLQELNFTVSAGVAHTKLMAKLCSGLNKPCMQTLLPTASVPHLLRDLPLTKLKGLGGQQGQRLQSALQVCTAGELAAVPLARLQRLFGDEDGLTFHEMAHGRDKDPVKPRQVPKSIGCGKSFTAHLQITQAEKANYWLEQLSHEMEERMSADSIANDRHASQLTLHFSFVGGHKSKAAALMRHDAAAIAAVATSELASWITSAPRGWAITGLSLSASNFHTAAAKSGNIRDMFARRAAPEVGASGQRAVTDACAAPAQCAASDDTSLPYKTSTRTAGKPIQGLEALRHGTDTNASFAAFAQCRPDVQAPTCSAPTHAADRAGSERHAQSHSAALAPPSEQHAGRVEDRTKLAQSKTCEPATSPQCSGEPARSALQRDKMLAVERGPMQGVAATSLQRDMDADTTPRVEATPIHRSDDEAGSKHGVAVRCFTDAAPPAPWACSGGHATSDQAQTCDHSAQKDAQQPWHNVEHGQVDPVVLAALPEHLRSEVFLQSTAKRAGQPAAATQAAQRRAGKRSRTSQQGLASFLRGTGVDG